VCLLRGTLLCGMNWKIIFRGWNWIDTVRCWALAMTVFKLRSFWSKERIFCSCWFILSAVTNATDVSVS